MLEEVLKRKINLVTNLCLYLKRLARVLLRNISALSWIFWLLFPLKPLSKICIILLVWCLMFWSLGVNHIFGLAKLQLQGLWEQGTSSSLYIAADFPRHGSALPQQHPHEKLWFRIHHPYSLRAIKARSKSTILYSWPSLLTNKALDKEQESSSVP